ncbi:hypothetical protein BJV74DRAFT_886185 [Russula compacta]|nr:hypothetical protein BJV74DRAFT_886185 [Russula compacta]
MSQLNGKARLSLALENFREMENLKLSASERDKAEDVNIISTDEACDDAPLFLENELDTLDVLSYEICAVTETIPDDAAYLRRRASRLDRVYGCRRRNSSSSMGQTTPSSEDIALRSPYYDRIHKFSDPATTIQVPDAIATPSAIQAPTAPAPAPPAPPAPPTALVPAPVAAPLAPPSAQSSPDTQTGRSYSTPTVVSKRPQKPSIKFKQILSGEGTSTGISLTSSTTQFRGEDNTDDPKMLQEVPN